LKRLLTGLALAAGPLLAEEASSPEKPGIEIWKWLNFAMLFGLLAYIAVKQGGPALAARSKEITGGLAAGEKAKAEAEKRSAEVTARLANLDKEIATLKSTAKADREREEERILRESQLEIARIQHQVEMEIESAGKQARLDVQRFAAKLAVDLAEQKVRARMSPEVQAALLDSFLSDFPRQGDSSPARTS
jgi:F-type H+-transporting ATPase subunit b